MRSPNANDVERLLKENEKRGFPGMLGSIDCMQWVWKNCPTAWHGQYVGKEGVPTIVLEAVASKDLWFWYLVLNEYATRYRQTLITTQYSFLNKIPCKYWAENCFFIDQNTIKDDIKKPSPHPLLAIALFFFAIKSRR